MFSFGMVLFEIFTNGRPAFEPSMPLMLVKAKILSGELPIPEGVPWSVRLLIEACWSEQTGTRADMKGCILALTNLVEQAELPSGEHGPFFDEEFYTKAVKPRFGGRDPHWATVWDAPGVTEIYTTYNLTRSNLTEDLVQTGARYAQLRRHLRLPHVADESAGYPDMRSRLIPTLQLPAQGVHYAQFFPDMQQHGQKYPIIPQVHMPSEEWRMPRVQKTHGGIFWVSSDTVQITGYDSLESLAGQPIKRLLLRETPVSMLRRLHEAMNDLDFFPSLHMLTLRTPSTHPASPMGIKFSLPGTPQSDAEIEERLAICEFLRKLALNATQLQSLDLSQNAWLTTLPDELLGMTQLTRLVASHIMVQEVPQCVLALRNLTHLDLAENNCSKIDMEDFSALQDLTYLDLSYNKVDSGRLPPSLVTLTNLTCLKISAMHLLTIEPDLFSNLKKLEVLKAATNRFTSWPEGVGSLPHLAKLCLQDNQIAGMVPAEISQLQNLKVLDLYKNRLERIAGELCWCTKLTKLRLHKNRWAIGWEFLDTGIGLYATLLFLRCVLQHGAFGIYLIRIEILFAKLSYCIIWVAEGKPMPELGFVKEISADEINVDEEDELGAGAGGQVFPCVWRDQKCALKKFSNRSSDKTNSYGKKELSEEHPFIDDSLQDLFKEVGLMWYVSLCQHWLILKVSIAVTLSINGEKSIASSRFSAFVRKEIASGY